MPPTRTALIIGGGTAGPVAAMALRQAGIDATVYEAHPGGERPGVFLLSQTLRLTGCAFPAPPRAIGETVT
jgi:2-polyprenyl-6-methoxyphenol hydroxylase-like FAD-dependent oxidoreductase